MSRARLLGSTLILTVSLGISVPASAQDPTGSADTPSMAPAANACPTPDGSMAPPPSDGAATSPAPSCAIPAAGEAVQEHFTALTGTETNLVIAVGPGSKVRAYACDGDTTALWWTGESADGSFTAVSSDGGATLDVTLGDSIDGTITFTDGTAIAISASPTTGAQGIYSVELLPDGTMSGTSLGGNTFIGQFDFEANTLAGEVTTPAGETITIGASQADTGGTTAPGSYLAVLDAVGQAKGFRLRVPGKPSEGFDASWVMP
jgi:hypothetical protein